MKAELIQRLFRAIGERDQESLDSLCRAVVEDERKKGHSDLATRLEKILLETDLYSNKQPSPIKRSEDSFGTGVMTSLPSNLKNDLFSMINREELRHHMVLPQEVEKRLLRIELEYTRKEVLATYGLRPRKRILLYGPPGNGKTLSAERLAWNTGLPLVKVRFDSLISSYLGETSSI
ncbi:AAA family ATPase [Leptospira borgpetersenii]|uniref:AAA family ATPase n=1 Tax=Leptospira borgpetersenii TaxID=174 RepID=UPI00097369E4|nr:AAA family ATPase [Leptospira borgpetersenii]ANH00227.2 ATPase, AAA family [Leptospira borgpetersenii str. 4E]